MSGFCDANFIERPKRNRSTADHDVRLSLHPNDAGHPPANPGEQVTSKQADYDVIGRGYNQIRRPDPRIAARIDQALAGARSVVNIGAGAGSYEPRDREVTAVEPSALMIAQRPQGAAPVTQARAESLPFANDSFDAAMAILTVHHWADVGAGLSEMCRIARSRVVILTLDAAVTLRTWIVRDYFPEAGEIDLRELPTIQSLTKRLPGARVEVLAAPRKCRDGFTIALWDRPELLLDPDIRRCSSVWHHMSAKATESGLQRLRADLKSGRWDEKYGYLRNERELDIGLRLVMADTLRTPSAAAA
jgi:SAM-dependent methyltransferase